MSGPRPEGGAKCETVVLTGPTGSGKGAVAFELARRLGAEIVSMDSMKVYREMDIGTAKPSPARRRKLTYHLLDVVSPEDHFSVGDYLPLLHAALDEIRSRGARALLCGGTALYLKAFLDGLCVGPAADWSLRSRLREKAQREGTRTLYEQLTAVDPEASRRIMPEDVRRIVRALEVHEKTGQKLSDSWGWGREAVGRPSVRLFGLAWERQTLYDRTDRRVLQMVEQGLFEEAQRLRERGTELGRSAAQCIGYKEIFEGMEQGMSREEIVERIQRNTRRFVKRQLTWFRRLQLEWIPMREGLDPVALAEEILSRLRKPA